MNDDGAAAVPAVVEAMEYARKRNVIMEELHNAVGKRLASIIGCEAAMVTGGATSAMTLATAACITGADPELIRRVPDLRGMKNEVIIQKSHRNGYDHAIRMVGVKIINVRTVDELKAAINHRTAMISVLGDRFSKHVELPLAEVAPVANKAGIPVLVDKFETSVEPKLAGGQWRELHVLCEDRQRLAATAVDDFMALLVR